MHFVVSTLTQLEIDLRIEDRIQRAVEDTNYFRVDKEFPWSEAEHYALWSKFYKGMDEDAVMNLENYLDR